jgi:FkbM family methyltransferase
MAEPREPSGLPVRYRGARFELFIRPWKLSDANVAREVLERRCYEKHSCLLSNCSHWLDAGAHIGCFAIAAALSGCRVDSFEPESDNAALFVRNTDAFRSQVTLHRAALLSNPAAEETTLFLAPRSTSFHSTIAPIRGGGLVQVPVVGFETFLRAHPSIDGLKMDVQGVEMSLLESLCTHDDLLSRLRQIVFEWDFRYDRSTPRLRAVLSSLEAAGFKVCVQKGVFQYDEWCFWPSGVVVHARRP